MGHNELLIARGAARPRPRRGAPSASSSARCAGPDDGWLGFDASPAAVKTSSPTRCGAWAPTTSTSTARPGSTRRPDRGDRRRDRRAGEGRLRAPHRPLRGRRARRCAARRRSTRSATCSSSTRCSRARSRLGAAGRARARHRRHRLRRAHARPAQRPLERRTASSRPATSAPTARATAATTSSTTSRSSTPSRAVAAALARASPRSRSPGSLARGDDIVALIGASRRDRLAEALGALSLRLDADDPRGPRAAPFRAGAAAGSRYPEAAMAQLDSER